MIKTNQGNMTLPMEQNKATVTYLKEWTLINYLTKQAMDLL
jgi:hypothetical protein